MLTIIHLIKRFRRAYRLYKYYNSLYQVHRVNYIISFKDCLDMERRVEENVKKKQQKSQKIC